MTEMIAPDSTIIGKVYGEDITEVPQDLFIPPDALEVFLSAFEGPLDLLLYLIKKQNIDILNIPIASITEQYMEYISLMSDMKFELAAEYLLMAAMLAEIKSRMLLPKPKSDLDIEDDPRAELIRRLQEYERFKIAAENLDFIPRIERDHYMSHVAIPDLNVIKPLPDVDLRELLLALKDVLKRSELTTHHQVTREPLSIRQAMTDVLSRLNTETFMHFNSLFPLDKGRMGVVVTFIAILELLRQQMIELVQTECFSPIHIKAVAA